jgi:hypothetical protein
MSRRAAGLSIGWAVILIGRLLSHLTAAEPARFAEPLDIEVEWKRIVDGFASAVSTVEDNTDFKSQSALAARNEALGPLVTAAKTRERRTKSNW